MSTNAQIGSLTTLAYGTTSPVSYTDFAEYKSIDGVGLKRPEVDVTHLQSTSVERIGGLPDGQTVKIMFNMIATNINIVSGLVDAGDLTYLRIGFPAPLSKNVYLQITPLEYAVEKVTPSGALEITLTGRITGDINIV